MRLADVVPTGPTMFSKISRPLWRAPSRRRPRVTPEQLTPAVDALEVLHEHEAMRTALADPVESRSDTQT